MNFAQPRKTSVSRRLFLSIPAALAGAVWAYENTKSTIPDPLVNGSGPQVPLTLLERDSHTHTVTLGKIVKAEAEWKHELSPSAFAVTRRAATEFAFANKYWHSTERATYTCVCCGIPLFLSSAKFPSGTGWPSFNAPFSPQNIYTKQDRSLAEIRTEVLCRKCDAHLGHLFDDGPPPTGLRYCLNSAALRLVPA